MIFWMEGISSKYLVILSADMDIGMINWINFDSEMVRIILKINIFCCCNIHSRLLYISVTQCVIMQECIVLLLSLCVSNATYQTKHKLYLLVRYLRCITLGVASVHVKSFFWIFYYFYIILFKLLILNFEVSTNNCYRL